METEERLNLMEKRLLLIEDEIEKIQKDLQLVGENTEIKTSSFVMFENSLTKKLIKENENRNTPQAVATGTN